MHSHVVGCDARDDHGDRHDRQSCQPPSRLIIQLYGALRWNSLPMIVRLK